MNIERKSLKVALSALLMTWCIAPSSLAVAAQGTTDEANANAMQLTASATGDLTGAYTYNVVDDFNADNTGATDAHDAINRALETAISANNSGQVVTIVVPAGTYRLDSNLFIYSNTIVEADPDAVFLSTHEGSMIKGSHLDETGSRCKKEDVGNSDNPDIVCNHGGYEQVKNVTIRGGIWDAGESSNEGTRNCQCILFRHAQGITLENLTACNFTNHGINVSGSKDVTINNVTLKDAVKYTGTSDAFWPKGYDNYSDSAKLARYRDVEALHLDFCSTEGEGSGFPQDDTPCENVTVKNCTFTNVFSGVGTHHLNSKNAKNLTVSNCMFTNLLSGTSAEEYGRAVCYMSIDGLTITGCTITNSRAIADLTSVTGISITNNDLKGFVARHGLYMSGCSGTVSNNKFNTNATPGMVNGIAAVEGSDVTLTENAITSPSEQGINVRNSIATIKSNTITKPQKSGISIQDGSTATIENNTVTNAKEQGVNVQASKATVKSNTIENSTEQGVNLNGALKGTEVSSNTISTAKNGIGVLGGSTATVASNGISGCAEQGINVRASTATITGNTVTSPKKSGIAILAASTATVSNNTVTGCKEQGINVNASKATVKSNTIKNSTQQGVNLNGALSGTTVNSNTIDAAKNGVAVLGGSAATLGSNKISNCSEQGINVKASTATVKSNTVTSPKKSGIAVLAASTATVSNNTISGCKEQGINVNASKATINGNTIKSIQKSGIRIDSSSNVTLGTGNSITSAALSGSVYAMAISEKSVVTGTTPKMSTIKGGGLLIDGSSKATLTGGSISSPAKNGVSLSKVKPGTSISDLKISSPKGDQGMTIANSSGVTVKNVTITNPAKFGILANASKVTIQGCTISGSGDNGIHLKEGLAGSTVKNNTVKTSKGRGIAIVNCKSTTVTGNTIANCTNDGIYANASVAKIESNTSTSTVKKPTSGSRDCSIYNGKSESTFKKNTYGSRGFYVNNKIVKQSANKGTLKLAKATLSATSFKYSGKAKKPTVKVVLAGKTLKRGTDYTVSYKNNTKVGTASVVITGKGNYTASLTKTFTIKK